MTQRAPEGHDLVVVANRLPVERGVDERGQPAWMTPPGGLVSALAPVMARTHGAWVGWTGVTSPDAPEVTGSAPSDGAPGARRAGETVTDEPFELDGIHLVPVPLTAGDVQDYYEGFSNATIWPLYHDVIARPAYHRSWWQAYREVNERFAAMADRAAAPGATVWVHDYQLQLVPQLLRTRRPDLRIGWFDHIPFPPWQLFAQLPWRSQILRGLLGADVVGFQRAEDARSFLRSCRAALGLMPRRGRVLVDDGASGPGRTVTVAPFPISIDSGGLAALAASEPVRRRAAQIREELGARTTMILGLDRLDYTKGIRHRLQAFAELLDDERLDPAQVVLVQVATPSRMKVEEYQRLRDEIELTVGRINGKYASMGAAAVVYLNHSYDRAETAALFRAADVMLVTPLRDGMNLVAKEYIACRTEGDGVLVLSEFTGAAVELRQAVIVNPHDLAGLKDALHYAVTMPPTQVRSRMRRLRRHVLTHDVSGWAEHFLGVLAGTREARW